MITFGFKYSCNRLSYFFSALVFKMVWETEAIKTEKININGKDMTIENLTMKLMWSLAHFNNIDNIKDFIEKELY